MRGRETEGKGETAERGTAERGTGERGTGERGTGERVCAGHRNEKRILQALS